MPTKDFQKIYDEAQKLLEDRPFVMLSRLGERVKGYVPQNIGLMQIIEQSDRFELLRDHDPAKRERVAVCKKHDSAAKKDFEKKYPGTSLSGILRSILCAFTQNVDGEHKVFIERKFPYKFKRTSLLPTEGEWIEVPSDKIIQKDGDVASLSKEESTTIVSNIKAWCSDNQIDFNMLSHPYKKGGLVPPNEEPNGQRILNNFLNVQRPEIKAGIIFPAEFIEFILSKK